jgi:hypothetical protein
MPTSLSVKAERNNPPFARSEAMRVCLLSHVALAFAATFAAVPACGEEPATPRSPDAASGAKSVTVFPVLLGPGTPTFRIAPGAPKKVAEFVGLLLERGGMKEIEVADAEFSPPEKADLAKVAEAFSQFVRSRNLRTEYALFGQFIGSLDSGVDEIRFVVVDRQGKVVLTERADRQQLTQIGEPKVEPMTATVYLVNRLRGLWGLADPDREDAPEGKMAQLWAKDSGTPSKAEREAMQSRLSDLKKKIKTSTVAVFPVRVAAESDAKAAVRLAEMLTKQGFGHAEAASIGPKLQIKPNTNEMRILWDTARAFQDFLRKNPSAADYALLADYIGKPEIGGVHFILCDRSGDWVLVELRNSHHDDFQRINPQSVDDCNRLVIEALKNDLR